MRYGAIILLLLMGLAAPSSRPGSRVEILVDQLGSPDPQLRSEAFDQLAGMGVAARPAVREAMGSGNPEIRARASELILKLPWSKSSDPGEVQRVLSQYGQHDVASRRHDVTVLASFSDHKGETAVVRLLLEDPSAMVRWEAVMQLHLLPAEAVGGEALEGLRKLSPEDQTAALLAGMALACRGADAARSDRLYQMASEELSREGGLPEEHLYYGDLLMDQGMRELARHELEATLTAPGSHPALLDAKAHFDLASLIGDRDDRAAADHLRAGIEAFNQSHDAGLSVEQGGNQKTGNDAVADLRAQMHFRYFRAAMASHNPKLADQHLKELLRLNPSQLNVVLEVVPVLKELGRGVEAKALFERAFKQWREAVDADPANAENLNNLAWLCARCGERVDEAVQMSQKAMQLAPDNAAYLDTAAEASFRAGKAEQAVKYETQALKLMPGDEFMEKQLKRFKGEGATTKP